MVISDKLPKVEIMAETTVEPLTLMGMAAGICYGSDTDDVVQNVGRGSSCLRDGHMRVAEFPQIYMTISGYSAAVVREFYTHIGGLPTRLQNSTRYIDYSNGFDIVFPPSVQTEATGEASKVWQEYHDYCVDAMQKLKALGVPKEDYTKLLPLASATGIVVRMNLRELIHMCHERRCNRAYWEFQHLMTNILASLRAYSEEWEVLMDVHKNMFGAKCGFYGYCTEGRSCGKKAKKVSQVRI